jgi:plastocyanin
MISEKTITTGMISVILLAIVATNSVNAQTYTREPYSETVANSPFTIYAGKNTQFSFTVPSDAVNVYLRGDMSITGGIVPVLDLIVSDSTGNTHSRSTYNGYGNVNILLPPGLTYYLTVRNGAILANDDKIVSPNFVMYYDRLVPVTDMTDMTNMTSMSNATMGGNMTGLEDMTMMTNVTGPLGGDSVTILPGSSSPSNGKFFEPETLTVSIGTTVTWTNDDSTLHTVTSGSPEAGNSGTEFDSSYLAAGKTFQHQFSNSGTFDYYCTLHPYMSGKIVVVS